MKYHIAAAAAAAAPQLAQPAARWASLGLRQLARRAGRASWGTAVAVAAATVVSYS